MLCVGQEFFELLGVFITFIKNFLLQQIFNNFSDYFSIYDFFSLFLDNLLAKDLEKNFLVVQMFLKERCVVDHAVDVCMDLNS